MNDSTANETHSKSGEDLLIANQDLEVELFLRGITDQHMWQDLISKWLAFESDYPIKGVLLFNFVFVSFDANVIVSRTYQLLAARRKLHGG